MITENVTIQELNTLEKSTHYYNLQVNVSVCLKAAAIRTRWGTPIGRGLTQLLQK